ncbi:MAG TPA: FMN-binding negative transcriptional regulator [Ferruginibacter sp.]|nr:FMN-binding negative transcriptional regulator [Ferruginibacter sp.]
MYTVPHYTETNREAILAFMQANPFVLICGTGQDGYPVATQVPVQLQVTPEGSIHLSGHIMRKTTHHRAWADHPKVMVVFQGPHTFISASWYEGIQSASTWNYLTVQAIGEIIFRDEAGTREAVAALTAQYEGPDSRVAFEKLPEEYIQQNLKAIIGFDIRLQQYEAVFKLSQNRTEAHRRQIITELRKRNNGFDAAIADEIEKRI